MGFEGTFLYEVGVTVAYSFGPADKCLNMALATYLELLTCLYNRLFVVLFADVAHRKMKQSQMVRFSKVWDGDGAVGILDGHRAVDKSVGFSGVEG